MVSGIYKITNPKGKIYIGQSKNIHKRFNDYIKLKCKGQTKLYNSLKKYGIDFHIFEIIENCLEKNIDEKEKYWINYYNSINEGLNIKDGGIGGKWSDEMKEKLKIITNTPEHKIFISNLHKGKINSPETRLKMRNSKLGTKQTKNTQINRGLFNKHSEEHISKFIKSKSKSIICINDNREFKSIKEAEIILGIDHSSIIKVLKGVKDNYKGLIFKYK